MERMNDYQRNQLLFQNTFDDFKRIPANYFCFAHDGYTDYLVPGVLINNYKKIIGFMKSDYLNPNFIEQNRKFKIDNGFIFQNQHKNIVARNKVTWGDYGILYQDEDSGLFIVSSTTGLSHMGLFKGSKQVGVLENILGNDSIIFADRNESYVRDVLMQKNQRIKRRSDIREKTEKTEKKQNFGRYDNSSRLFQKPSQRDWDAGGDPSKSKFNLGQVIKKQLLTK